MKISRSIGACAAAGVWVAGMTMAGDAQAQNVLIKISGPGDPTTTFILPASPTPDYASSGYYFGFYKIAVTIDGYSYQKGFAFYNQSYGGGLTSGGIYGLSGATYYTGNEKTPTFVPGVYTDQYDSYSGATDTVSITAVPEPASWALLLAGFGGLGGALRARRGLTAAPDRASRGELENSPRLA